VLHSARMKFLDILKQLYLVPPKERKKLLSIALRGDYVFIFLRLSYLPAIFIFAITGNLVGKPIALGGMLSFCFAIVANAIWAFLIFWHIAGAVSRTWEKYPSIEKKDKDPGNLHSG
jgi:hypothetical protein